MVVVLALGCARAEQAAAPRIEDRVFTYQAPDGTPLQGYIAWDAAGDGRRPGVLVVHEWWGENDHTRNQARRLAQAGYVGMAIDLFGNGKVTEHPQEAQAFVAEATKHAATIPARFNAALEQLRRDPHVDTTRVGAIGHCFGGMVVLSMAQAGADLDAVASFHGAIPDARADSGTVHARMLVLTGEADSFVPADKVEAFRAALQAAGARIEVVTYPGAKHGFTNPQAGSFGMEQLAYDAHADSASWSAMRAMLREVWP
jgi:dienelactone hydrolase